MNVERKKLTGLQLKRKAGNVIANIARYVFLLSVGYVILYPMFSMISVSLKTEEAFMDATAFWIPSEITFDHFVHAFSVLKYKDSVVTTLLVEVVSAALEVISCGVVAYGFARFEFRGKRICEFILLAQILIPMQVYIVSILTTYVSFDIFGILGAFYRATGIDLRFRLYNTYFTMYLPSILAVGIKAGIMIYIYKQFFKGFPKELEEAASVDGAGPIKTFIKIMIPSSGVVILTVSIFALIWHWNDFQIAMMYFDRNHPLAVMLADIENLLSINNQWTSWVVKDAVKMASCVIFILPVLIVYLLVQNKFIRSIDKVGITG